MFEEVPRERRGVARLLPVRRVVLGPFVLGGGMLLATLGGSVAVAAAAATMITASAIGSKDVPAHPGHPVSSASGSQQAHPARRSPEHHRPATPATAGRSTAAHQRGAAAAPSMPHPVAVPSSAGVALPAPAPVVPAAPPARGIDPTAVPSAPADRPSVTPAPSSSAPLGNAVIHVSGYRQATERLAYQFASVRPGAGTGGGDQYQVLASDTFTASLAPSITITSGGGICLPAGSACTVDQLIQAADSGFFAVVAIDAQGELRSIIEVGYQPATPKLIPAPSTPAAGDSSSRLRHRHTSPAPGATS
ncbi:hypothetical protein [Jatrophihabitans sp.]|jgi:hypothetical protein|uniref:hypothetical protein n=1 Tax=Jatrophihabitans sp. TaxID=1932789 RepID=UPI002F2424B0